MLTKLLRIAKRVADRWNLAWCAQSAIVAAAFIAGGCAAMSRASPYQHQSPEARNSLRAQGLTQEAADILEKDPRRAERLLTEALSADLFCGPAHNNLGVVYLNQGRLYEAAGEFEWAKKLMPGSPEPRVNLAATLERAGRMTDALAHYDAALEASPGSIGAMQGLARLQLRTGRPDERTPELLSEIALRGETVEWRDWARARQASLPR